MSSLTDGTGPPGGFLTPVGQKRTDTSNTIPAVIDGEQTLSDGSKIRLRTMASFRAGVHSIPSNTTFYGLVSITGQRLTIKITSIEWRNNIVPVNLSVYDTDGLAGLHIPSSSERDAVREGVSGITSGMGSGINISTDAGAQIVSDVVRGTITGTTQYLTTKLRDVKITVKSGYRVLLMPNKQ